MAEDLTAPPDPRQPDPTRPSARAMTKPAALVTRSLATLERELGGRNALVAALAHAPKSRDLEYVLGLVGDPSFSALPLAEICAMGGITPGELLDGYKAGQLQRAHALSAKLVGEQLPGVVADTLRLAQPHEDTCHGCQGTGSVTPEPSKREPNPRPQPCPLCAGSGVLIYAGDLDHKKLALELGRLTSKHGGVSVQVDARSAHVYGGGGGEAAGGTLEQLQLATDRILYGGGPGVLHPRGDLALPSAVDAELIEEQDQEQDQEQEPAQEQDLDPEDQDQDPDPEDPSTPEEDSPDAQG